MGKTGIEKNNIIETFEKNLNLLPSQTEKTGIPTIEQNNEKNLNINIPNTNYQILINSEKNKYYLISYDQILESKTISQNNITIHYSLNVNTDYIAQLEEKEQLEILKSIKNIKNDSSNNLINTITINLQEKKILSISINQKINIQNYNINFQIEIEMTSENEQKLLNLLKKHKLINTKITNLYNAIFE